VLEDFLDGWPGTVVVVTHDRYFLERVSDSVYSVPGNGTVRHLPRGVEQYLEQLAAGTTPRRTTAPGPETTTVEDSAPVNDAVAIRAAKKDLNRIERQLAKLTEAEAKLHDQLAANASDYERLAELDTELRKLADERGELETAWFDAAERAE
jgi:ATP-binding cassette subfamily F protein uup